MFSRRNYLKTTGFATLAGSALSAEAEAEMAETDESQEAATAEWPMRGYDPAQTSYNPTATPPKSDITIERIIDRSRPGETLLVGDGALFNHPVGSAGSPEKITVWDKQTGEIRWEKSESSTPVLRGDGLYVSHLTESGGTSTTGVRVLSTEDGSVRRTYDGVSRNWWNGGVPEILPVGDMVYFRHDVFGLFALSTNDGTVQWETPIDVESLEGFSRSQPQMIYADGSLYTGTKYGLSAIDAETGSVRWSFDAHPLADVTSGFIAANGTVLIGDNVRNVFALDAATGCPKWTYSFDIAGDWSPVAATDELVYVTQPGEPAELYAVGLEDGTVRWSVTDEPVQRWKVSVGGDVLYAGTNHNRLYAFDARDGTQLWEYVEGAGKAWSHPVLVGDTVYVVGPAATGSFGGLYRLES